MKPVTKNRQISGNTQIESNYQRVQLAVTSTLFDILSEKLYQNPLRSAPTEAITNAADAIGRRLARMSKKEKETMQAEDRKFKIVITCPTVSYPYFVVRDEGTGIDNHDDVVSKFFGFNQSDKTSESTSTGSMGLGAKSVYAIAEQFSFTLYDGKTKRVYQGLKDEQGFPLCPSKEPPRIACDEPRGAELKVPITDIDSKLVSTWQHNILSICRNIGHDKNPFDGAIEIIVDKGQASEKTIKLPPKWANWTLDQPNTFAYSGRLLGKHVRRKKNSEASGVVRFYDDMDEETESYDNDRDNLLFSTENCALIHVSNNTHNARQVLKECQEGVLHYANIIYKFNATSFKEKLPWLQYYKLHIFLGNTRADGTQHPIVFNPSRESLVAGNTDTYLCDLAAEQMLPVLDKLAEDILTAFEGKNLYEQLKLNETIKDRLQRFSLPELATQVVEVIKQEQHDVMSESDLKSSDDKEQEVMRSVKLTPWDSDLIKNKLNIPEDYIDVSFCNLAALNSVLSTQGDCDQAAHIANSYICTDTRIDKLATLSSRKSDVMYSSESITLPNALARIKDHPVIAVSHKSIKASIGARYLWNAMPIADDKRKNLLNQSKQIMLLCKKKDDVGAVARELASILAPQGYRVVDVVSHYKDDFGFTAEQKQRTSIRTIEGRLREFAYKFNYNVTSGYRDSPREYWDKLETPEASQEIFKRLNDKKNHKVVHLLFDGFSVDVSDIYQQEDKTLLSPIYVRSMVEMLTHDYRERYQKTLTVVGVARRDKKILEAIPSSFISLACRFIKAHRKQIRDTAIVEQFMRRHDDFDFANKFHPAKYMFHSYERFKKGSVIREIVREVQKAMPSLITDESFLDSVKKNKLQEIKTALSNGASIRDVSRYFVSSIVSQCKGQIAGLVESKFESPQTHEAVRELVKLLYEESKAKQSKLGIDKEMSVANLFYGDHHTLLPDYVPSRATKLRAAYPLVDHYVNSSSANTISVSYVERRLFRMIWVQDLLGDKQLAVDTALATHYNNIDSSEED
jgi:uncharacterized membrane protein YheB (UPF0754 family)